MTRKDKNRVYKNLRYNTDPEWAAKIRERNKEYSRRPEVRARRKAYLQGYVANKKANHPEWVKAERDRSKAKQRAKRADLRRDPVAYAQFLEKERNKKAGVMRESKVESALVEMVELLGGFCPKWVDTTRRGAPDRIVMLPGRPVVFVELKRPTIRAVAKHQERYHSDIRSAGQRVVVLNSIDEVMEFIRSEGFF